MQIVNVDETSPGAGMLRSHALLEMCVMPMPDGPPIEIINSFGGSCDLWSEDRLRLGWELTRYSFSPGWCNPHPEGFRLPVKV